MAEKAKDFTATGAEIYHDNIPESGRKHHCFMEIQRKETDSKGKFYIEDDGHQEIALMTYSKAGADKIIIDHTEVDESLQGKGIGEDLVAEGVKFARENNLKIIPLCPFAKAEFDKHDDYADVLAK